MNAAIVEKTFEFFVDWALISDSQVVKTYVDSIRANHPTFSRREIAQKIVDEQAFNNGMLGAATGLVSTAALPFILPLDVIKTWKIQDFTIKSVAYVYDHTPQNTDLKTAIFLLLANGSLEELKQCAIAETTNIVTQSAFNAVDALKTSSIQVTAKEVPKYATKALIKSGETIVSSLGMGEAAKYLSKALCKVCGKKITEKVLQRSITLTVPVIGATIGGGIDWLTTQAVGNLAIEFFDNSGIEFLHSLLTPQPDLTSQPESSLPSPTQLVPCD